MGEFSKKIIKNSFFSVLEFTWPLITSFIATPFIVHKLGTDGYGILAIVTVTLGFFAFVDLGLGIAAVRDVAEHYEKKDFKMINRVLNSTLLVFFVMGALGALMIYLASNTLVIKILNVPQELIDIAIFAFYFAAMGFFLNMINGVFAGIPKAIQRYDISTKISIFIGTITVLLTVIILYLGYGLKEIVMLNLGISLFSLLIYIIISKKLLPQWKVKPEFDKEIFIKLSKFGSFFLIASVSGTVLLQLDKLLIGSLLTVSLVTFYVIPSNLTQKIQGLMTAAMNILFPVSSALSGSGQIERLKLLYFKATKVVLFFATAISVPIFIFSNKFLFFWLGGEFAIQSTVVMMILVPTYFILGVTSVPWSICLGVGKSKVNAFFSIIVALLNVALILIFVKPFGLNGVALAYLLSVVLVNPFVINYIEKKILGLSGFEFWKLFFSIIFLGVIQGFLGFLLINFATSLLSTLALMGITALIFPALYYLFGYLTDEDKRFIGILFSKFSSKRE